mgnify:CR=1 FL=1
MSQENHQENHNEDFFQEREDRLQKLGQLKPLPSPLREYI